MQKFGLRAANLMCLFFLGKHPEGLTPSQLCTLCGEDKAGISKSLALLKKSGYVSAAGIGRKYRILYKITPDGETVYNTLTDCIDSVVKKAGDGLTDAQRQTFYLVLDRIVENLRAYTSAYGEEIH